MRRDVGLGFNTMWMCSTLSCWCCVARRKTRRRRCANPKRVKMPKSKIILTNPWEVRNSPSRPTVRPQTLPGNNLQRPRARWLNCALTFKTHQRTGYTGGVDTWRALIRRLTQQNTPPLRKSRRSSFLLPVQRHYIHWGSSLLICII